MGDLQYFDSYNLSITHSQHYKDLISESCPNAIEGLWHRLQHFLPASGIKTRKVDQISGSFNEDSSFHFPVSDFV